MNWKNVLVVLVAILIVIFLFARGGGDDGGTASSGREVSEGLPPVTESDHAKGPSDAEVTLIEYGDFQCPACAAYFPFVKRLEEEYGDRVRIVYRHFPLTQIHRNASVAARATEVAAASDKFFEMHDLIYSTQREWSGLAADEVREYFAGLAGQLGIDQDAFLADIDNDTHADKAQADMDGGRKAGVGSTPSFFINGVKIENPRSYEGFAALVAAAFTGAAPTEDPPADTN